MNKKLVANAFALIAIVIIVIGACLMNKKRIRGSKNSVRDSIVTLSEGFVFETEQPFAQCHASTVLHLSKEKFLIAWFGGTHEKHDDVGIWISKGKPGKWSVPVPVAKIRNEPHWNPVLFRSSSGEIILYFKVGRSIDDWETRYKTSNDNGETWSDAKELVPGNKGGRGPVRNKPIVLTDGTWLAPASNENACKWNAFVDRSKDQGKTWKASAFIPFNKDSISGEGVIQPALWQSTDETVHMLLRSSAGVICRSDSKDNGITWSSIYKTNLPNPNSSIDLTQLRDGMLALVYNRSGKNWGERRPLSITFSSDDGNTWPSFADIETGNEGDEFSYPSIDHLGDTLFVTYTWKRKRIAYWMGRIGLVKN